VRGLRVEEVFECALVHEEQVRSLRSLHRQRILKRRPTLFNVPANA
jgi:hypothetical protein